VEEKESREADVADSTAFLADNMHIDHQKSVDVGAFVQQVNRESLSAGLHDERGYTWAL